MTMLASVPFLEKFALQIKLLLWKRLQESTKSKWDLLYVLLPAWLFLALCLLLYKQFSFFVDGTLEPLFVPLAFWVFVQRIVVQIMSEKQSRLQESMRMMGLYDSAYWISYFLSDGVILGFVMSFSCACVSAGGLFNGAGFGEAFILFFVFCLSAVPFSFFLCPFFSTPQTSGQATLGILLGLFVVYITMFVASNNLTMDLKPAQVLCCLVPPLGLQIGSSTFRGSYDGISLSTVMGMMVADIFIYTLLAWYFSQVWPSELGVRKPWYFLFQRSYWAPLSPVPNNSAQSSQCLTQVCVNPKVCGVEMVKGGEGGASGDDGQGEARPDGIVRQMEEGGSGGDGRDVPTEKANESLLGAPTVEVKRLRKTFGSQKAVNNLSFQMYENQIFALLGHNGAGKTTTINMLTGLNNPDSSYHSGDHNATIYGKSIFSDMDSIRHSMGVCPQHDVLFDKLSVREHIMFFAQLKGASLEDAREEATSLITRFHLEERLDHLGHELSGGQRRKLSVAIAVCGGSKFVVLDEPTAGMDPLARRELWDLMASLRQGRTMLLTTHYMDEADILGDRVGIMSLGQMQCMGSTQFLKSTYGAGYKLVLDKEEGMSAEQLEALTAFVEEFVPEAECLQEDGAEEQALYMLPFSSVGKFGALFAELEADDGARLKALHVSNFGITITSLEDVFLKVGEDHTVTPTLKDKVVGIGANTQYQPNMYSQIIGIMQRKLVYASNDFVTVPLLALPIATAITAAVLSNKEILSKDPLVNTIIVAYMYIGGFLGAPGLIAEFIVRERNDKLRNVLTVMGCDFRAYWIGTFLADFAILSVALVVMWVSWFGADMKDFYAGTNGDSTKGLPFLFTILFVMEMLSFSYFFSSIFSTPKSCISYFPILLLLLMITPQIGTMIAFQIAKNLTDHNENVIFFWGQMVMSPQGALLVGLASCTNDFTSMTKAIPKPEPVMAVMIFETIVYLAATYYLDRQSVAALLPSEDPTFDPAVLQDLDEDVQDERDKTAKMSSKDAPLVVSRLRKVFPAKAKDREDVVAAQDVSFSVGKGEIFGLLGANGAGKTTTLSMLTRLLVPSSGNAFVSGHSILGDFPLASSHLGVVTQNNSLWDRLSVESHLFLFARLRGVPEDQVAQIVDSTIDELELTPHRKKMAMALSGGMKRKLCVAIALIGDPDVVLLDEPSAGLDPISRHNLWSVILRTMSHRAVILTTHSMEEAEALCKRIGIMVHGQMRALGTKQHLKNKFGSRYELVVKLVVGDRGIMKQREDVTQFVAGMFPSAHLLADNGGLLTFQIPRSEMRMGVAFSQLERHREELCIEDYSIAQPTLEQVFIRTVNNYDGKERGKGEVEKGSGSRAEVSPLVV